MRQLLSPLPALLAISLLATTLGGCFSQGNTQAASNRDSVSVTGVASVQAVADEFVIQASAVANGKNIKPISQTVNSQANQVLELADKLGIKKKNLKALGLTLSPRWQYQPKRELIGYQAKRDITITLTSMDNYGVLMQGLIDIGITHIGNTQARVSNKKQLTENALANAVENARDKAQKLAKAAGRKLGDATNIQEQGNASGARPIMMRAMAAESADSTRFEPGQMTLQQRVSVTFALD